MPLYIDDASSHSSQQFVLNLAEMWMCCIFQTLTPLHLDNYLPGNVKKVWAGRHLNVALPLWQSFSNSLENKAEAIGGRAAFTKFLQSPDFEVRQWAESLRDGFNQLRNSPDSKLRNYYRQQIRFSLQSAAVACQNATIKRFQEYFSGKEISVNVTSRNKGTYYERDYYDIRCGMFLFTISQDFGLSFKHMDKVSVQSHLSETEHPMKYACRALKTDPASRLAISVTGHDSNGMFVVWLESKTGTRTVFKMNTLVDILEKYTYEERKAFPRRWFLRAERTKRGKWGTKGMYT